MELRTLGAVLDRFESYGNTEDTQQNISICMCGISVEVRSSSHRVLAAIASLFRNFVGFVDNPQCVITVHEGDVAVADGIWSQYDGQSVGSQSLILGPSCICRVDASFSHGIAVIGEGVDIPHYVASIFRAMALIVAKTKGKTLIHSSGVVHGGKVLLFIGQSESGKSTVARLSSPRMVLSDEAVLLEELDEKLICRGTPYGREHPGTNVTGELGSCLFLSKSSETFLEPLAPAQALPKLMSNLWGVRRMDQISSRAFALCTLAIRRVPCYELHFRLSDEFWGVIETLRSCAMLS